MSAKDKADEMARKYGNNYDELANRVWKTGDQELIMYLIRVGFSRICATINRKNRQIIKENAIRPEYFNESGPGVVRVKLTPGFKSKHIQRTIDNILSSWKIGGLELGQCTKIKLLEQASAERKAGKGHLENAIWYERLAAPMNEKETVASYWRDSRAIVLLRNELLTEAGLNSNSTNVALIEHRTDF